MIHFKLICQNDHEFDGWFRNGEDFEIQQKQGFLTCAVCGSDKVEKTLMAPAIADSKRHVGMGLNDNQNKMLEQLQNLTRKMRANADYVGDRFSEEARKIHFGEKEQRAIYGEATNKEVKSLVDEGIDVLPLPELPEDKN